MFFKNYEENKVIQKVIYMILGINQQGHKDILGFYSAETEGANFYLGVLNGLKNGGLKISLLLTFDALTGFSKVGYSLCLSSNRNSALYGTSNSQFDALCC